MKNNELKYIKGFANAIGIKNIEDLQLFAITEKRNGETLLQALKRYRDEVLYLSLQKMKQRREIC